MSRKPLTKKWSRRKKRPANPFDAGWGASVAMFAAEHELTRHKLGTHLRSSLTSSFREAEYDLFQAEAFALHEAARLRTAREAAASGADKRNAPVVQAMRGALEAGGAVNIAATIRELNASGELIVQRSGKKARPIAERTARQIIKEKIGVVGKPGRRKGS